MQVEAAAPACICETVLRARARVRVRVPERERVRVVFWSIFARCWRTQAQLVPTHLLSPVRHLPCVEQGSLPQKPYTAGQLDRWPRLREPGQS